MYNPVTTTPLVNPRFNSRETVEEWFRSIPIPAAISTETYIEALDCVLKLYAEDTVYSEQRRQQLIESNTKFNTLTEEYNNTIRGLNATIAELKRELSRFTDNHAIGVGDLVVASFCEEPYIGHVIEVNERGVVAIEGDFKGPLYVARYKVLLLKKKPNPIADLYQDVLIGAVHNLDEFTQRLKVVCKELGL